MVKRLLVTLLTLVVVLAIAGPAVASNDSGPAWGVSAKCTTDIHYFVFDAQGNHKQAVGTIVHGLIGWPDSEIVLEVEGLVLQGDRAAVVGRVIASDHLPDLGTYITFLVEDNGQGGTAAPDRIATLGTLDKPDMSLLAKALHPQFDTYAKPITAGDIQIN